MLRIPPICEWHNGSTPHRRSTKVSLETNHLIHFSDEPHWVEVLTEVLLSLLTRPSSLFRHIVDQVFTMLAPHLTLGALNMILEVGASFHLNEFIFLHANGFEYRKRKAKFSHKREQFPLQRNY